MGENNKLAGIQHVKFQILPVHLNFGLFWSAGIPTMVGNILRTYLPSHYITVT